MNRRSLLKRSLAGAACAVFPTIVPAHVLRSETAPSNKLNIAQIGFGRIAKGHDLPETMKNDVARVIAVCDVDSKRKELGKAFIEDYYRQHSGSDQLVDVQMYDDYRELLADSDIDGVIVSTPDHWHAQPAIEAALAGKDVYLQKPTSLTVEEGRMMSDIVHRTGIVFQLGSQQRSTDPWPQFRQTCELVRNGRIGTVTRVEIGLPSDPAGGNATPMDIPPNLNYEMWLGSTPYVPYTVDRVHPQDDFSRPGWLRCEQFGAGMITGWGVHHIDIAHWGMGTEYTGPVEVEATAKFPTEGLWTVHGDYHVTAKYANGVEMQIDTKFPNGINFIGSKGNIFVSRGSGAVTASDPTTGDSDAFSAQVKGGLDTVIKEGEVQLYDSPEQHRNWLDCMQSRQLTISPAEVAHRSCTACLIAHIAMKVPGKLRWDPVTERFRDNDAANRLLSRSQRFPYGYENIPALADMG
ncbi:Inositol 2-dehydrogenase/D-chiro-inositol 3-dehydrogenase [Neolewinella maritima]|uniref:Inositol 2-dehydrogenase/D-chiro-inositol 3-dehydrogenase n=1 Tax=Neolewinella maritima TaxID=1383882 RepID=A0ABM9B341_9BACT|nr:Gfo/Idh/MocA family oxidoreductase [Neolewinella maritima]CAH1001752.1 Inositol 2-dehydrogenase/D-chiro-inositol 3-dehydrogenase [Neolewinella maritima]